MSMVFQSATDSGSAVNGSSGATQPAWYAVQTVARHEKKIATELQRIGIEAFVPTLQEVHHWSDRKKVVDVPLFPCYAFVNATLDDRTRVSVLRVSGVRNFVGQQNYGTPIPDDQIEQVRTVLQSGVPMTPYPYLKVGERVEIQGGALDGLEGVLVEQGRRLVVSVHTIQRSLCIAVDGYNVRPAKRAA